jgi:hypothetical protein
LQQAEAEVAGFMQACREALAVVRKEAKDCRLKVWTVPREEEEALKTRVELKDLEMAPPRDKA